MANQGAVSEAKCSYDVFLSFRNEDPRPTFTTELYNALDQKGIITFMDTEELKAEKRIGPTLEKAIEESRSSIVIFSENYADSTRCLNELVKIRECMRKNDQIVIPIFYKVEPSDVRHQKRRYGEAMAKHERRHSKDVPKWKSTLFEIASLSGKPLIGDTDESKFIQEFVSEIFIRVCPKDLTRKEHIVGREDRVEELKSRLQIESRNITCMLGIHGAPGIGKTTLAKALYDSIYNKFEGSCFLSNVRETSNQIDGLRRLQRDLLSNTLEFEDNKFQLKGNEEMIRTIKTRLGLKRVLIVLDDVDDIKQLNNLAGERDWFGPGSMIIITTRDKHLLDVANVENENRYEVNVLNDQESLDLFCHFAFKKSCPEPNYKGLTYRAMRCCKGNPLALKILGSHLNGEDLEGWEFVLDRYAKSTHPEFHRVFRISYDSLPPNEKNIFLDVACFFKGQTLKYVRGVLGACGFHSGDVIATLVDRSLLTVDCNSCLGMHDLIQEIGRNIVKEEEWGRVGERSRLWFYEDVRQVLVDNIGSSKIQGIMLDPPQREEINCIDTVFEKMNNLRILIVRNTSFTNEPRYLPNNLSLLDWKNYPSHSLPSDFYPWKIGAFNFRKSRLRVLDKAFQTFESLIYMNISNCQMVTEFPDVSGAKNLIELRLDGCNKLVKVHQSVGCLAKLVYLSASKCTQLVSFVPTIELPCLEYLSLSFCIHLAHFPNIKGKMDKTLKIHMTDTAIKELPKSMKELAGLNYLDMTRCVKLQDLPSSLLMSTSLVTLKIGGCYRLRESFRSFEGVGQKLEILHFDNVGLLDDDLHAIIRSFPNLKDLNLSWNNFLSLPACITESTNLTSLDLSYCTKLREIPGLPSSVQKVDARHCNSLTSEASEILWSQVRKKMDRLEVKMPRREIPKWFNHVSREGWFPVPPIFWARGSFPAVALAFVFGEVNDIAEGGLPIHWRSVGLRMFIDERSQYKNFILDQNHVLLCDLRILFNLEWKDLDVQGNDWKTIRVHCETEMTLCSWGVYVYKDETNMEDIQFVSPGSSFSLVLYPRFPTISEEEEKQNRRESMNMREISEGYQRDLRKLQERGFYEDKRTCLEDDLKFAATLSRLGLWQERGFYEGTSGLNIEDGGREEVKSTLDWIAEVIGKVETQSKGVELPSLHTSNPSIIKCGASGLTKPPYIGRWHDLVRIELMDNKICELPESPDCPKLEVLLLQGNADLMDIPDSFFKYMPLLQYLDLSNTSIRDLPPSITKLTELKKFYLRSCDLFVELPPKIGELKKLEELDLKETLITHLPKEIQELINLKRLILCFDQELGHGIKGKQISNSTIIPPGVISNLTQLNYLSINVDPEDDRWNENVTNILVEIFGLERLKTVSIHLPKAELLELIPTHIYLDFRLTVGHHMQRFISRVTPEVEQKFRLCDHSIKFVNGIDVPNGVKMNLGRFKALYLDRHMTIKSLSDFELMNLHSLRECILAECNEMETIVDGSYSHDDGPVLPFLESLIVFYMKNLRSICKGSNPSFSNLKSIALHTCPMLTTIFSVDSLNNLSFLEELIIEDCPKVTTLISHDSPEQETRFFLPRLKMMSLLYLPELVTIFNGLHVGQGLEKMLIYYCPKLRSLSKTELSSKRLRVIKGDSRWWDALKWNEAEWRNAGPPSLIFSPINEETNIMPQLVAHDNEDQESESEEAILDEGDDELEEKHDQGAVSDAKCSYDVFLSFRGEDSHTFTTDLYDALEQKGIITFMNNEELKAGKRIGPTPEKAIEESRSSIVVFSENYADSTWCLNELVKIHECMLKNDQIVIPIFYKVESSDVRHQKRRYGEAMAKHERRFGKDSEDVSKWKSTLREIANLSGYHLRGDESRFIQEFVSEVFIRVSPKNLTRNEHIVGREYRVKELKSRLQIESPNWQNHTCMLGIHGAPGIGKTTLAKALYDSVYKKFEGSCFLSDVRETSKQSEGLRLLQQRLLSEILEDKKFQLKGTEDMIRTIKTRLGSKRLLIVLDDVDDIEQLNNLAGERDWFGLGSRIIITTRDKHLLDLANVENENRYEVNVLNDQESLDLICHTAFKKSCPEPNYEDLTYRAMRCCKGIPSALKGLGFHLIGKDLEGWEDAVDRYEKSPHPEVQKVFGISYDSLPVSCRFPLSYQF